jgi:hypothetical protein
MAALRIDFVFSYWIFVWYILYVFKITTFSPKFPLIIGLIYNIIMFLVMLAYGTSFSTIINFLIINIIIKTIPLYRLRNEPIMLRDIVFTIILLGIYGIWLHLNGDSLIGNAKLIHDSLLYDKGNTPFIAFVNKLKNNFKNLEVI